MAQVTNNQIFLTVGELVGEVKQINAHLLTLNGSTAKAHERLNVIEVAAAKTTGAKEAFSGLLRFFNSKVGFLIVGILGTALLAVVGGKIEDAITLARAATGK